MHGSRSRGGGFKTTLVVGILGVAALITLLPFYWLAVSAGKSNQELRTGGSLLPSLDPASYWNNIVETFTYNGGAFTRWLLNAAFYSVVSASVAVYSSAAIGVLLAFYHFRGRRILFGVVIGSLVVPATMLVIPTFILESITGISNTVLGVIAPLCLSPVGAFFMFVYAREVVPASLLDAARVDGAGEVRIFHTIILRLLVPGLATLFILVLVASWNNYFLPLVLLNSEELYPSTLGLGQLVSRVTTPTGGPPPFTVLFMGSVISILPMLVIFPLIQRHVATGLTSGAVAGE